MIRTIKKLKEHNVQLQSVTESLDHSSPQGKLLLQLLGSFAEFSSDMLGEHVKKGLKERAMQGRHTGGIPFGYESCWINEAGEKRRRCEPEHTGGIHTIPKEALAVAEAFRRYASGTTRLYDLACWFNEGLGLRTRNTKKLANGTGGLEAGPRLFTTFSIRGILHNRFYAGFVRHNDVWYPGSHEPVISIELFDQVQDAIRKNNGRSATLNPRPEREYLLQGIVRCAYCLMPMWAQTYSSGRRYYREYRGSRGNAPCPAVSGSIPCEAADEQVGIIVQALELRESWMEEVMARIALKDQVEEVKRKRRLAFEKLQRLGKAYVDGVYQEEDYKREKRRLELDLESLVVPQVSLSEDAGKLLKELPSLWAGATMGERRKLLLAMLDGVYIDTKELRRVVAIQPKPAFRPIFEVATMKAGSGLTLIKESPANSIPFERFRLAVGRCSPIVIPNLQALISW
jgi:site-specific DNA recombinase